MKVTCESCGSKYTIKDDKVRGKRVKIRCKGCKNPIVVDGTAIDGSGAGPASIGPASIEPAADTDPPLEGARPAAKGPGAQPAGAAQARPAVAAAAGGFPVPSAQPVLDERWSVNLTETDSRDMTTSEIVAAWGSGLVTEDAFVYKPGFADWQPLLHVPELAALLTSRGAATQPAAAAKAKPMPGRAQATGRAGDLFGGTAAASKDEYVGGSARPMPGDAGKATGARNESSVLFSLDALKAGFEPSAAPAPSPPSRDDPFGLGAPTGLTGFGGGFDQNQALFAAPPPEPKKPKIASLAPAAAGGSAGGLDRTKLFVMVGAVVALLVVVGGVGFALGGRSDDKPEAAEEKGDQAGAAARVGKGSDEGDAAKDRKGEAKDEKSAADSDDKQAKDEPGDKQESASGGDKAEASKEAGQASAPAVKGAAVPAAGTKTDAKEEPKEKEKPKAEAAADNSGAPPFDKGAAIAALASAAANAASCKIPGGPTGSGKVLVTFAPSGRVTTANVVGGNFGGSSVGGCVASRFRRASVPPFSGSPVTVSKSFSVK